MIVPLSWRTVFTAFVNFSNDAVANWKSRSLKKTVYYLRDCKRNLKWPSIYRDACPIYKVPLNLCPDNDEVDNDPDYTDSFHRVGYVGL